MAAQNSVLTHIARPYAAALFELAQEGGTLGDVESGVSAMAKLAAESPDFTRFLRSPVISANDKVRAIETIMAKGKAGPVVANFVRLVARNGRLFSGERSRRTAGHSAR